MGGDRPRQAQERRDRPQLAPVRAFGLRRQGADHDVPQRLHDTLKAAGLEPEINVKVLLDSEEEKGSPTIGTVATTNHELLRAEAIVINDGPMHETSQPTIVFGNRGNTLVALTVYGPKVNLHSGHYGNYAPNPAQRLAALLASMKDDSGRVTVKGYYDGVKLTDAERKVMAEVRDDEAVILKRLGISKPKQSAAIIRRHCNFRRSTSAGGCRGRRRRRTSCRAMPSPRSTCAPRRAPTRPI
jgi:acetylornithine deacetylase/succinyl-diaminopimelate desuccinylase-like protein